MGKGRKGRVIGSKKAKLEPPMTLEQLQEIEEQLNNIVAKQTRERGKEDTKPVSDKVISISDLSKLTTYGWYEPDTKQPLPPIPAYPYSNKRLP